MFSRRDLGHGDRVRGSAFYTILSAEPHGEQHAFPIGKRVRPRVEHFAFGGVEDGKPFRLRSGLGPDAKQRAVPNAFPNASEVNESVGPP